MALNRLSPRDLEAIAAHGLGVHEVERQWALLASPPPVIRLERPATVGDGIRRLEGADSARLLALAERAALSGRLSKFVPASGAATRMFQGLATAGSTEEQSFLRELPRFAFAEQLLALKRSPHTSLVELLLGPEGLGYAELPKGLITFHRDRGEVRTAFDEHLAEAAATVRDQSGRCRLFLTVSPEHRALFEQRLAAVRARWPTDLELAVGFSHQEASTDTVALGEEGDLARHKDGSLLFRPGGHGALLGNLEATGGDVVLIKNIDNVVPASHLTLTARWKWLLAGVFLELEQRISTHLGALETEGEAAVSAARAFATAELNLEASAALTPQALRTRLDRPLRVCGMVTNQGEPGGGPYWVRSASGGLSLQIVESAQMDLEDAQQQALVGRATHFNPVDLVCGLRDRFGRPWELARFVDPTTAFVTEKSVDGRKLRVLEHPGLWNGAMAGWITVFVEVPGETFTPVKTVFDLLRPEHQPAFDSSLVRS